MMGFILAILKSFFANRSHQNVKQAIFIDILNKDYTERSGLGYSN